MIFDKISNIQKYKGISKDLDLAIETISTTNFQNAEIGKYELDGKNVFYMIQEYDAKDLEACTFETHNNYADIQLVISGEEGIGYADYANLEVSAPFNPEKDVEKQKGDFDFMLEMNSSNFVFFFPGEPHMPTVALSDSKKVKKAVFKIKF